MLVSSLDLRRELRELPEARHEVTREADSVVVKMQPERFAALLGFLRLAGVDSALLGSEEGFAAV